MPRKAETGKLEGSSSKKAVGTMPRAKSVPKSAAKSARTSPKPADAERTTSKRPIAKIKTLSRANGSKVTAPVRLPKQDASQIVEPGNASSLTKMLGILDLFSPQAPIWSTNDLIEALETSRSTAYRYIKAMNNAGLLSAVGNGYYVLGPRIIELDLQIRTSDPLLQAGKGVLEQLVDATNHSVLLCTLFKNSVLCIRELVAPLSPENMFSRGQRRTLFRGAMSKVILAHLPNHRLRNIFDRNHAAISEAELGDNWVEFRETLSRVRKDGYFVSHGEFNPGVVGVAAAIFNREDSILGSVGVVLQEEELGDVDMQKVIIAVKRAAREISQRIAATTPGMDMPPRAVG